MVAASRRDLTTEEFFATLPRFSAKRPKIDAGNLAGFGQVRLEPGRTKEMSRPLKTVEESRVVMSRVMEPTDANFLGKVFGGSILSLLDLCAYATASKFAGNICVTASFDRVDFHEPIEVGELVVCEGFVSFTGRTSVEVTIQIYADNILTGAHRHTNTARVTMVAIKEGRPVEVPMLDCRSIDDKRRFLEGRLRRELRAVNRAEFDRHVARFAAADEAELNRLLGLEKLLDSEA
jgi:acyl-CoA hydrolase